MTEREELDKAREAIAVSFNLQRSGLEHAQAVETLARLVAREEIARTEVRARAGGGDAVRKAAELARDVVAGKDSPLEDCNEAYAILAAVVGPTGTFAPAPVAPETGGEGLKYDQENAGPEWSWEESRRHWKDDCYAAQARITEAVNELHCCDDVPLDKGLAFGIAALRSERDAAQARIADVEKERDEAVEHAVGLSEERFAFDHALACLRTAAESTAHELGKEFMPSELVRKATAILTAALTGTGEAQTEKGGDPDTSATRHDSGLGHSRADIVQPAQEDSPVPAPYAWARKHAGGRPELFTSIDPPPPGNGWFPLYREPPSPDEALVEALTPFGDVDGEGSLDFPDETKVTVLFGRTKYYALTLGDFRTARAALAARKGG